MVKGNHLKNLVPDPRCGLLVPREQILMFLAVDEVSLDLGEIGWEKDIRSKFAK